MNPSLGYLRGRLGDYDDRVSRAPAGWDVDSPVQAEVFVLWLGDTGINVTGPCGPEGWYIELGEDDDPVAVVSRLVRSNVGEPVVDEERALVVEVLEEPTPPGGHHRVAVRAGVERADPPALAAGEREVAVAARMETGVQTLALGILGEYIWRTFHEVKRRPLWFVEDATFELERARS